MSIFQQRELERVQQRYEKEAEQLNQLVMDMQHCHRLVTKSVELGSAENVDSKLQLATNGTIADLGFALKETQSEMLQIEVVCENAISFLSGGLTPGRYFYVVRICST